MTPSVKKNRKNTKKSESKKKKFKKLDLQEMKGGMV